MWIWMSGAINRFATAMCMVGSKEQEPVFRFTFQQKRLTKATSFNTLRLFLIMKISRKEAPAKKIKLDLLFRTARIS